MTESGAPMFGPEGSRTKAGYAEKYNFPLEEAKFDTLFDYSPARKALEITLPKDRKLSFSQSGTMSDKVSEQMFAKKAIQEQMAEAHEKEYINLFAWFSYSSVLPFIRMSASIFSAVLLAIPDPAFSSTSW